MVDERPAVWIGHEAIAVHDVARSADFWRDIGMREIERNADIAILELRGGTHLLLFPGSPQGGDAPFDLMVDDLEAAHARWTALGLKPSAIEAGDIHSELTIVDPDGYRVTVRNSHVVGNV